jgi:uncharacterized protein (TIGR03083 family)
MVARTDQTTDPALLQSLLQARRGTAFFARKLNELSDAELDAGTLLPGWTRRHVVAHVGYNARAIARLIEWAATGVETPMYSSPEARNHEIEFGATLSPIALRHLFDHSAVHLNVEWRDLPADAWHHKVKTAQGRTVPAEETAWMRTREVWMHAVDLDNGATFTDIPVTRPGTPPHRHHRRLAHPRHRHRTPPQGGRTRHRNQHRPHVRRHQHHQPDDHHRPPARRRPMGSRPRHHRHHGNRTRHSRKQPGTEPGTSPAQVDLAQKYGRFRSEICARQTGFGEGL